jgi:hypothetical protein
MPKAFTALEDECDGLMKQLGWTPEVVEGALLRFMMLFSGKTRSGSHHLWPRWWCFFFEGGHPRLFV